MIEFLSAILSKIDQDDCTEMLLDLYVRHYKLWRYKVLRIVKTDEVDDIIHDVFTKLMTSHLDFLKTLSELKRLAYISKAIENDAKKHRKGKERVIAVVDLEPYQEPTTSNDPANIYEKKVNFEIFLRALENLPDRQRDLLYYKFFEELPDSDIAALLEIQPASIRSALTRARRTLDKQIKREENRGQHE